MMHLFDRLLYRWNPFLPAAPEIARLSSFEEYTRHARDSAERDSRRREAERALARGTAPFSIVGYCYVCKARTRFNVTFDSAYEIDGALTPNWREHLQCRDCRMTARQRSLIHLFELECRPAPNVKIMLSEQRSPLHTWFCRTYPGVIATDYRGDSFALGAADAEGIRNEDLTRLSFQDNVFDHMIIPDVLEHIPGYPRALAECLRCLRPGGTLFVTVPFENKSATTIVRARVNDRGEIEHLWAPEYHSDPLKGDGSCLSYYIFGWDLLDRLRDAGYAHATALLFWSDAFGYLGGSQMVIVAGAPGAAPRSGEGKRP